MDEPHTHAASDDIALYGMYALSAIILVALYREPIVAFLRDAAVRYRAKYPRSSARSIRPMVGRMWDDVRGAIDNAGRN